MSQIVLEAKRVSYIYRTRHRTVQALNEVSYRFESGKVYAIVGKSGCGKSTLISVLAGLYLPSMGHVLCHGKDTLTLDRTLHRRHDVAVIYQNYNLFPLMTVMENVLYPLSLQRKKKKEARVLAEKTLGSVGLPRDYYNRLPAMLSGGEQQRVAIARAIAGGQKIILADEPTGNLDEENSRNVMDMLKRLAHEEGYCVVIVTHDPQVAADSDAVIRMSSGRIMEE